MELWAVDFHADAKGENGSSTVSDSPTDKMDASKILDSCRSEVEQLFQEDLKVKEIAQAMREKHNINVTEKMCRDRLRKWGLRRNITKHQVQAMVRKQRERQLLGKETIFEIRGKEYSLQKPGRYWRHHLQSIRDIATKDLPPAPIDMVCLTPPPVPIDAPDELSYHHRLLRSVRDYCFGNFESGIWTVGSDCVCVTTLMSAKELRERLNSDLMCTRRFGMTGDFAQARKTLELASPVIKSLILCHEPLLLPFFLWHLRQCWKSNRELYNVVLEFLGLVTGEVTSLLGKDNPLYLILQYFSCERLIYDELYTRLWKSLVDTWVDNTGLASITTATMIFDYNEEVLAESDGLAAIKALEQLVDACKTAYGTGHRVVLMARATLASCLHRMEQNEKAEEQQLQAVADLDLSQSPNLAGGYNTALIRLAYYQNHNGKPDAAEATLREACRNCWILCGKTDSYTLNAFAELKRFLRKIEKFDAAEEVDVQIAEIMDERERRMQRVVQYEVEDG